MKKLAADQILPRFLAATNPCGAAYLSIIVFVALCMTLFLAIFDPTNPTAIKKFGGVFAISFLSVLIAFGIGACLLKLYRAKLPRLVIAKWWQILVSVAAVVAGLIGNIILTPSVFVLFLIYLVCFVAVVVYMFSKVELFSFGIWMV